MLVVARADHFDGAWPQGFVALPPPQGTAQLAAFERTARFVPRDAAEHDPDLKQLIPYCAIRAGDRVLRVERLAAQSERRLHGKGSIGIGGHVNAGDGPPEGAVRRALDREIREEIQIPAAAHGTARLIGLINDDGTEVGRVHVGLAFVIELGKARAESVRIREISKMKGSFRSLAETASLWQHRQSLESWSRILVGGLVGAKGLSEPQLSQDGDG